MNIKGCRIKAGQRQEDLAVALHVGRSTVAKWESGDSTPRATMVPMIAIVLACNIADLYEDREITVENRRIKNERNKR